MTCATSGRRIESQHAPPPSLPSPPPSSPSSHRGRPELRQHYAFASCRPLDSPAPSGQADGTNAHRARGRMRQPARAARRTSAQLRMNGGEAKGRAGVSWSASPCSSCFTKSHGITTHCGVNPYIVVPSGNSYCHSLAAGVASRSSREVPSGVSWSAAGSSCFTTANSHAVTAVRHVPGSEPPVGQFSLSGPPRASQAPPSPSPAGSGCWRVPCCGHHAGTGPRGAPPTSRCINWSDAGRCVQCARTLSAKKARKQSPSRCRGH